MLILVNGREAQRGETRLFSLKPIPLYRVWVQSLQVEKMLSFLQGDSDNHVGQKQGHWLCCNSNEHLKLNSLETFIPSSILPVQL